MRGQRQKRLSLVRGSGIDLDVLRDGGRRQQGRERLRQGLKQRTALFRAAGIDLTFCTSSLRSVKNAARSSTGSRSRWIILR